MREKITSFMASKRNVVMELEDERRGGLPFRCDVAEYFSGPNVKLEGHKPGIHEYAYCSKRQFKQNSIHCESQSAAEKLQI